MRSKMKHFERCFLAGGLFVWATMAGAQSTSFLGDHHPELGRAPIGEGCADGEIHDDGVPEDAFGWNTDLVTVGRYMDRFDPISLPFTYDQVCICWVRSRTDTELAYQIEIFDDNGPDGRPGRLLVPSMPWPRIFPMPCPAPFTPST